LAKAVRLITGYRPRNIELYSLAMQHTSVAKEGAQGTRESNERLEYLGDAILGAVVAEYLFKKYPFKDEGFLTEIRSRLVNRESLNQLAVKIGLSQLVAFDSKRKTASSHKSLYGDAMEAFIGAFFLDRGFKASRAFIIKKLLRRHFDLDTVIDTTSNFKSKVIEWAQKQDKQVAFEVGNPRGGKHGKQFRAQVLIDGEVAAEGTGFSKKQAQQDAARKACEQLGILDTPSDKA
jgi:ribonuclease-3